MPAKGQHHSESSKAKLRAANSGHTMTDAQRQKLSLSKMGKSRGPLSESTKAKLSASKKGRSLTEEHRQKLSDAKVGRKFSPEVVSARIGKKRDPYNLTPEGSEKRRKKMQGHTFNRGRKHTPETKQNMSEARKGMKFSDEHVRNMSRVRMGVPLTPEARKRLSESHKNLVRTEEHIANIRKSRQTPEARKRTGEISKAQWEQLDDEIRAQRVARLAETSKVQISGTKLEVAVWEELQKRGIAFVPQKRIGQYIVDIYIPQCHAILEVNGCYWHGCSACGYTNPQKVEKDRRRIEKLTQKGYIVIIVWEHTLKQDVASALDAALNTLHTD